MNLTDIRAGLETRLKTVVGLRCYSEWPTKPEFPAAIVAHDDPYVQPHETFGASRLMIANFEILLIVGNAQSAGVDRAIRKLDGYIPEQLLDAVYGDRTLGGTCDSCTFDAISGLREYQIGGIAYLGHALPVQVHARHS